MTVTYLLRQNDYVLVRPVSHQEIWDHLNKMNGSSCPGTDATSTKALRLGRITLKLILAAMSSFVVGVALGTLW